MKFLTHAAATLAAAAALLAANAAQAATWTWSYTGTGVTASGTFATAGPALVAEDIISFTGRRNGINILGLVPLDTDGNFSYDNQFTVANPHFTEPGVLFDIGGGLSTSHINVYYDTSINRYIDLVVDEDNGVVFETPITFSVTAVPEAATYAYMALGLAGLGVAARRRKTA